MDNGDPASDELFQAEGRSVFHGRALLVVRAKRQAGEILVKATAEGFEPATLTLTAK